MKKVISLAIATTLCFMLFGCGDTSTKDTSSTDASTFSEQSSVYNKEDFLFYNAEGKVIARPLASKEEISLRETFNGETSKQVAIGDDALTALAQYDLCYGVSIYYKYYETLTSVLMPRTLFNYDELEQLVLYEDYLEIHIFFTEEFDVLEGMAIASLEDEEDIYKYKICFIVSRGKISDVLITERFD